MILLGLTSWSEHKTLDPTKAKLSLADYASRLPLVEIDTFFYGLKKANVTQKWVDETPDTFKFIVKTHQCMTLHRAWEDFFESEEEMFDLYLKGITPLIKSGKLLGLLMQFPPFFECQENEINYLKKIRKKFKKIPIMLEFRHESWFNEEYQESMLSFMKHYQFSLVIVDEPQVKGQSVPFYPVITTPELCLVRLHGRNTAGWQVRGEDWRKKRTLYDYSKTELFELAKQIRYLTQQAKQVAVIFNNNSGSHAAGNCLVLKELLQLEYEGLNPEQTSLF